MNFVAAVRKGLDANDRAIAARQEMDAVLQEASKQLTEALGAELILQFVGSLVGTVQAITNKLAGTDVPPMGVLEVVNKASQFEHLADVSFGELGYPVTLRWGNERGYATNRAEFEVALTQLLESRITGERIGRVLSGSQRQLSTSA